MHVSSRKILLCRYGYDPLDRTIVCTPYKQASLQRFYCNNRLVTEIQETVRYSFFHHDNHVLAQHRHRDTTVDTLLLATDQQRSVLNSLDIIQLDPFVYSPYGHRSQGNGLLSLLGFNGERPDPITGHYHLGNGYRQFNPCLMRFNSPDSWSPFGNGGLNAYAYCAGDPINKTDPTGHFIKPFIRTLTNNNHGNALGLTEEKIIKIYKEMKGNNEFGRNKSPKSGAVKGYSSENEVDTPRAKQLMTKVVVQYSEDVDALMREFEKDYKIDTRVEARKISSVITGEMKFKSGRFELFGRIAKDFMSEDTAKKLIHEQARIKNYIELEMPRIELDRIRKLPVDKPKRSTVKIGPSTNSH